MVEPICYVGAKDICKAVGENPRNIIGLVERHKLPAWKIEGRGRWRALPEDLAIWVRRQRRKYLKKNIRSCKMPRLNICMSESGFETIAFADLRVGEVFMRLSQVNTKGPCPHIKVEEYRHDCPDSYKVYQAISLRSGCSIQINPNDPCVVVDATLNISFRRS